MTRKLSVYFAALLLSFAIAGCSSSKKDDAAGGEDVAGLEEMDGGGDGDMAGDEIEEFGDGDDGGEIADDDEQVADLGSGDDDADSDDDFGDDDLADDDGDDIAGDDDLGDDDLAGDDLEPADGDDDLFADDGDSGTDLAASDSAEAEPLAADPIADDTEPMGSDDTSYDYGSDAGFIGDEPEEKTWIPVKKIKEAPFRRAGVLANSVYLVRPDDTIESVSQKIYGQDKSSEMLSVNPHLSRSFKTGDKVYYGSPQRPNDDSRMMTFYEDMGLQPELYVSQPGDNIRKVAMTLLGNESSWKEVWATNMDVESKGEIPEGTRLRYWGGSPGLAAAPPPAMDEPPQPPAMDEPPMDEPADVAAAEPPPPPPSMDEPPPPPPPPPVAAMTEPPAPPPPPPPAARSRPKRPTASAKSGASAGPLDDEMMLMAGGLLIIVAALLFVIIRKRRARRALDFHTATHTQID